MSLVVVDTDVASTLLRRRTSDAVARRLTGHTVAITFITYGEPTKWTLACCLVRDLPLATFTIKDFADFAEHEGLEIVH